MFLSFQRVDLLFLPVTLSQASPGQDTGGAAPQEGGWCSRQARHCKHEGFPFTKYSNMGMFESPKGQDLSGLIGDFPFLSGE